MIILGGVTFREWHWTHTTLARSDKLIVPTRYELQSLAEATAACKQSQVDK